MHSIKNIEFQIGGIVPLTCIDFPGHIASVIFTQSCSLRCKYCHNSHLIPRKQGEYSVEYLINFLTERKNFLEGVVFSGGEPFMQKDIRTVMSIVKELGLKIGCHTSGVHVEELKQSIELIDWIGIDIKAMKNDYEQITGIPKSGEKAYESLNNIIDSGIDYEVRTTVYPYFFTQTKVLELAEHLSSINVHTYFLQEYRPILPGEQKIHINTIIDKKNEQYLQKKFKKFGIRK